MSFVVACAACGNPPDEHERTSEQGRRTASATFDAAWQVGGNEADSTLLFPTEIAAGGGRVYVFDAGSHEVVAFDAGDGSLLWRYGGRGAGPRELGVVSALAVAPEGLLVADPDNGRIAALDPNGALSHLMPLGRFAYVTSICPLPDGTYLYALLHPTHPLVRATAEGQLIERHPLPWEDLRGAGMLPQQGVFASTSGVGTCVFLLSLGRGFAIYEDGQFTRTHSYVERFDPPRAYQQEASDGRPTERIESAPEAARGGSLVGDRLAVPFGGSSATAMRQIDFYDTAGGDYLYTYKLPRWFQKAVYTEEGIFLLTLEEGYPSLVALAARAASPSPANVPAGSATDRP